VIHPAFMKSVQSNLISIDKKEDSFLPFFLFGGMICIDETDVKPWENMNHLNMN
jgi:hypothetical protein